MIGCANEINNAVKVCMSLTRQNYFVAHELHRKSLTCPNIDAEKAVPYR